MTQSPDSHHAHASAAPPALRPLTLALLDPNKTDGLTKSDGEIDNELPAEHLQGEGKITSVSVVRGN
jgi:hypothetical protein